VPEDIGLEGAHVFKMSIFGGVEHLWICPKGTPKRHSISPLQCRLCAV